MWVLSKYLLRGGNAEHAVELVVSFRIPWPELWGLLKRLDKHPLWLEEAPFPAWEGT